MIEQNPVIDLRVIPIPTNSYIDFIGDNEKVTVNAMHFLEVARKLEWNKINIIKAMRMVVQFETPQLSLKLAKDITEWFERAYR